MDNQKFYDNLCKSDDFAREVVAIIGGSFVESDDDKIRQIVDEICKYPHLRMLYDQYVGNFS